MSESSLHREYREERVGCVLLLPVLNGESNKGRILQKVSSTLVHNRFTKPLRSSPKQSAGRVSFEADQASWMFWLACFRRQRVKVIQAPNFPTKFGFAERTTNASPNVYLTCTNPCTMEFSRF